MNKGKHLFDFLKIIPVSILLLFGHNFTQAQSKAWLVPREALNVKNPLASDASSILTGKALYTSYCSPCHGDKGKGDGVASAALSSKPADHTSATIQSETDGSLFYKLSEGRTPMPQYKSALNVTQRWELINYIRTLAKKTK